MAVSPKVHHETGFLEESFWYQPDDISPSGRAWGLQTPQPRAETTIPQPSCPIDEIYPLIDSCEKARIVATMALNLLVFDGKLHHNRTNWACPFGPCKENFSDAKALMRHVPSCPHFSGDKVYCNCCNKDDCFAKQSQNGRFCCSGDDSTPLCNERSLPKKSKTMRKLTNNITDFFTRSRSASRCSTSGSEPPVSPSSTSFRRQSVFSVMIPTPSPSSASRKKSVVCPPELAGQPAASGSPAVLRHEMDAVSPALFELPGPGVTRAQELPASEHRVVTGPGSQRTDSAVSKLSLSTADATAPTFTGFGDVTESPAEDLCMDSKIPNWDVLQPLQEANAACSRQGPQEMVPSHFQFSSASAPPPVSQHQADQHRQPPWALVQPPILQLGVQLSPRSAQDGMYFTDGNHASFAILPQNSCFQPMVSSSKWQPVTGQYRQGSGDSGFFDGSQTMSEPGGHEPSTRPGHGRQPGASGGVPRTTVGTSPDSHSPPGEMEDFYCPYCNYRPKGRWAGRKANLHKHIKNQHESDKIACPGCDKEFSRKDNLAAHQTKTCKRRLFGVAFQSARRHTEWETGHDWVDGRDLHAAKRARQDSRVAW